MFGGVNVAAGGDFQNQDSSVGGRKGLWLFGYNRKAETSLQALILRVGCFFLFNVFLHDGERAIGSSRM